jgi:protein HIRA/HIR1
MVKIVKPVWVIHGKEKDGKPKPIYSVDIHADGKRFVTAGGDNTVRIWNMAPLLSQATESNPGVHKSLATLTLHTRPVNSVRWATKSLRLASGSDDTLVLLWQLTENAAKRQIGNLEEKQVENWRLVGRLRGHTADVTDIAWSPDETQVASCSLDNFVIVWTVDTLQAIARLKHDGMVKGVSWDPMGKFVSSASDDQSVKVWRCSDWGQEATVVEPYQKQGRAFFRRLSWSPDGVYVATSHGYKEPQHISPLLRRTKDFAIECDFVGHSKAVVSVRFNPAIFKHTAGGVSEGVVGKHYNCVAIGSQDNAFSVWVATHKRPIIVSQTFFTGSVLDITWGGDGYTLMCCSLDGTVAFFQFEQNELGLTVDAAEKQSILTALYGDAKFHTGSKIIVPESSAQLEREKPAAQEAAAPDQSATEPPVNVLATRPKAAQPSVAPDLAPGTQHQSTAEPTAPAPVPVFRQLETRKDGKRRIAPQLMTPAGGHTNELVSAASNSSAAGAGSQAAGVASPISLLRDAMGARGENAGAKRGLSTSSRSAASPAAKRAFTGANMTSRSAVQSIQPVSSGTTNGGNKLLVCPRGVTLPRPRSHN